MRIIPFILASILWVSTVQAQKVTAYGYSGDLTGDPNSRNGIGNHDNQLIAWIGRGFVRCRDSGVC